MILNRFAAHQPLQTPRPAAQPVSRPAFSAHHPVLLTNPPKFGNGLQDFADQILPVDPNGDWRQVSNHPAPLSNKALILISVFPALVGLITLKLADYFRKRNEAVTPESRNDR